MTRFLAIASGKGGVGKTTVAINLGMALSNLKKDIIILDSNLETPDIGINLGLQYAPNTIHDVLSGKKSILESIYLHDSGLKVIPGSIKYDAGRNATDFSKAIKKLHGATEVVVMEVSGLNKKVLGSANEVLIVVNPELASVTNALRTIKVAEEKDATVLGVVINRVKGDPTEMSVENIQTMLGVPIIGIIPEDDNVKKAQFGRYPVCYAYPKSSASDAFNKIAASLAGESYEEDLNTKKDNWFVYALKKMGLR
jgi:septum site-determining protein MinD